MCVERNQQINKSLSPWLLPSTNERLTSLRADPNLAALEMLLLPDRHDFLQAVDGEMAGFEGSAAMCGRDCDDDARFTDGNGTDAMHDGDLAGRPPLLRGRTDLAHLGQRHLGIRLVLELGDRSPAGG